MIFQSDTCLSAVRLSTELEVISRGDAGNCTLLCPRPRLHRQQLASMSSASVPAPNPGASEVAGTVFPSVRAGTVAAHCSHSFPFTSLFVIQRPIYLYHALLNHCHIHPPLTLATLAAPTPTPTPDIYSGSTQVVADYMY